MKVVEFGRLDDERRAELIGDEEDPFEVAGITLSFRPKERHVGLEDEQGRLIAAAGLVLSEVDIARAHFPVVGLGGVIVNAGWRRRGIGRQLVETTLAQARRLGPDFAMLFCLPNRMGFYRRLGFVEVSDEVRVKQPVGYVTMPLRTMWAVLRDGAEWPAGTVRLETLPF